MPLMRCQRKKNYSCSNKSLNCVMNNRRAGCLLHEYPALSITWIPGISASTLPNPVHFSPTYRAHALSCWLPILHGYRLGVFHFPFGSAFHTVCLHRCHLLSTLRPFNFEKPVFQLQMRGFSVSFLFLHPQLHGKINRIAGGNL